MDFAVVSLEMRSLDVESLGFPWKQKYKEM